MGYPDKIITANARKKLKIWYHHPKGEMIDERNALKHATEMLDAKITVGYHKIQQR